MPRIIIVDDDQDIVFMIKAVLEIKGYEVLSAADGHEALKLIKTMVPDLMIIDLSMPVMDGWRLSMNVRQDARYKNLPIIVLSGLLVQEENQQEPNEPYNVYISKPFDILKLAERVKSLLGSCYSLESGNPGT